MEQSAHIKEMEVEMDKLIKEKEHSSQLVMVPLDTMLIASLLQTGIPTATTIAGTSSSTSPPSSSTADDSIKLAQSMENMSIQGEEIKKTEIRCKGLT